MASDASYDGVFWVCVKTTGIFCTPSCPARAGQRGQSSPPASAENVYAAAFYRLPIVMMAVNRTLGPPWNIWLDHGDTLMLRDSGWVQLYCEDNQEVLDSILIAFRLAEDRRVLLPVVVAMDAFIVSHTQTEVDLPEQELVDRYLPDLDLPHRIDPKRPVTVGGLAWPAESAAQHAVAKASYDETLERTGCATTRRWRSCVNA